MKTTRLALGGILLLLCLCLPAPAGAQVLDISADYQNSSVIVSNLYLALQKPRPARLIVGGYKLRLSESMDSEKAEDQIAKQLEALNKTSPKWASHLTVGESNAHVIKMRNALIKPRWQYIRELAQDGNYRQEIYGEIDGDPRSKGGSNSNVLQVALASLDSQNKLNATGYSEYPQVQSATVYTQPPSSWKQEAMWDAAIYEPEMVAPLALTLSSPADVPESSKDTKKTFGRFTNWKLDSQRLLELLTKSNRFLNLVSLEPHQFDGHNGYSAVFEGTSFEPAETGVVKLNRVQVKYGFLLSPELRVYAFSKTNHDTGQFLISERQRFDGKGVPELWTRVERKGGNVWKHHVIIDQYDTNPTSMANIGIDFPKDYLVSLIADGQSRVIQNPKGLEFLPPPSEARKTLLRILIYLGLAVAVLGPAVHYYRTRLTN